MLAALLLAIFASLRLHYAAIGRRMAGQVPPLSSTILFASLIFLLTGSGKQGKVILPAASFFSQKEDTTTLLKTGHFYFALTAL